MKIFHYIQKFYRFPPSEKKILIKGLFVAFTFKIVISILPIKYYLKYLNLNQNTHLYNDLSLSIVKSRRILQKITYIFPFTKNCLIKAITLKYILKEYGINCQCVFSIRKDTFQHLYAHAYLRLDTKHTLYRDPEYCDVFAF